jgi:autotransporter-associated beta strand protein
VAKQGGGVLALSGHNTYTGGTTIDDGTLQARHRLAPSRQPVR